MRTSIDQYEERLEAQISYREAPSGQSKYGPRFGLYGNVPWCMMFLAAELYDECRQNGEPSPLEGVQFKIGPAHSMYPMQLARAGQNGFTWHDNPVRGSFAIFDWDWRGQTDHIGFVVRPIDGGRSFLTIEGNTSSSSSGSQSDGGGVWRRTRSNVSGYVRGFALPDYGKGSDPAPRELTYTAPAMTGPDVEKLQHHVRWYGLRGILVPDLDAEGLNSALFPRPPYAPGTELAVDGEYGLNTHAGVLVAQKRLGLEVDGVVGPKTRAALKL